MDSAPQRLAQMLIIKEDDVLRDSRDCSHLFLPGKRTKIDIITCSINIQLLSNQGEGNLLLSVEESPLNQTDNRHSVICGSDAFWVDHDGRVVSTDINNEI